MEEVKIEAVEVENVEVPTLEEQESAENGEQEVAE